MRQAAIFDIDRTILKGNTGMIYTWIFLKRGYLNVLDAAKIVYYAFMYKIHRFDYERGMKSVYSLLAGHRRDEIISIIDEYYDTKVKPKIHEYMKNEINRHKKAKRVIIFATNSMQEMVQRLSRELGCDYLLATKAIYKEGRFTGNLQCPCFGKIKAEKVKELAHQKDIDLKNSYSYSDHYSDRHMLMLTGYSVCVNPDKKLKKFAKSRSWKVINI